VTKEKESKNKNIIEEKKEVAVKWDCEHNGHNVVLVYADSPT